MTGKHINLDWHRLLGFDQAGAGTGATPLQAKIGQKGPPTGILGRPQELPAIKARVAA